MARPALPQGWRRPRQGLSVAVVDERPTFGGQIFKQPGPGFRVTSAEALGRDFVRGRSLLELADGCGAELLPRTSAVAIDGTDVVLVEEGAARPPVEARRIVLAPGAHDRPVVFPGWTLPGVITAGGAQTLVKTQRMLPGRRIVFAGSGPLALAFPAQLRGYGANVTTVLEAGPRSRRRATCSVCSAPPAGTCTSSARRSRTARGCCVTACRFAIAASSCVPRARGASSRSCTPAWEPTGARVAGTEETECRRHAVRRLRVLPLGRAATARGLRVHLRRGSRRPRRDPRRVAPDERRPASRPRATGQGVQGSYVADRRGPPRCARSGPRPRGNFGRTPPTERATAIRARTGAQGGVPQGATTAPRRRARASTSSPTADTIVCRCEELTARALDEVIAMSADLNTIKGLTRVSMGMCQGRNCQRHAGGGDRAQARRRDGRPAGGDAARFRCDRSRSASSPTPRSGTKGSSLVTADGS